MQSLKRKSPMTKAAKSSSTKLSKRLKKSIQSANSANPVQKDLSNLVFAPSNASAVQRYIGPTNKRKRSYRFPNSELVASVNGTTGFTVKQYRINPGDPVTFPWLSTEATRWDHYKFHKLSFRYVTRSGSQTVGSVILSPEYNVNDPTPQSETEATDVYGAVEDGVWKELVLHFDVESMFPTGPRKYIRGSALPADLQLYDAGNLNLCTLEELDTTMIGKLWVDYDVEFFVPQLTPKDLSIFSSIAWFGHNSSQAYTTGVETSMPFNQTIYNGLGITKPINSQFILPQGGWLVDFVATGNSTGASERFVCDFWFTYNGTQIDPSRVVATNQSSSTGGNIIIHTRALVLSDGSSIFRCQLTMSAPTGSLSIQASLSQITFQKVN